MLVLALHTYIHTYKLTFVSFFYVFFAPFPKKTTLYLVTICDLSKNIMCLSIILGMPPKADYWRYFNVVGVVAYCLIAECKQPNVSLGALPKPGEKKRLCEY